MVDWHGRGKWLQILSMLSMFTIGLTSIKNGLTRIFLKNRVKTFALVQLGWNFMTLENRLEAHNLVMDQNMLAKDMKCNVNVLWKSQ
jgi:hypothetical protein